MKMLTLCMPMAIVAAGMAMPAIAPLAAQGAIGRAGNAPAAPSQPYTAEFKITTMQTLANGATIANDLSEPDPSTFQPPEGYEVVTDEMHQVACRQAS